jgi:hypothetical protein
MTPRHFDIRISKFEMDRAQVGSPLPRMLCGFNQQPGVSDHE